MENSTENELVFMAGSLRHCLRELYFATFLDKKVATFDAVLDWARVNELVGLDEEPLVAHMDNLVDFYRL